MMAIKSARQSALPADAPCSADQSGIMSRFPESLAARDLRDRR
jgi:hypothetical protein